MVGQFKEAGAQIPCQKLGFANQKLMSRSLSAIVKNVKLGAMIGFL